MSKTNPIPPGTRNLTVNIPLVLADALRALAQQSGVSRNVYCRRVLESAAERKVIVTRQITMSDVPLPQPSPHRDQAEFESEREHRTKGERDNARRLRESAAAKEKKK